jgi:hypothetical protein
MRIGKDEIGPLGILALILVLPAGFLTAYGFLTEFIYMLIGLPLLVVVLILYYADLFSHTKSRKEKTVSEANT